MTANRTPNLPIRRIDNLEIPTFGTWPVVRASSVTRSSGRRQAPRQIHVLAGQFEIGEDPHDSSLRLDLDDSTLVAGTTQVTPDRHGMSQWHLEGSAESVDGHHPLALTLSYHGVFRRGVEAWAWMSGTGTIATPSSRRGRRRSAGDRLNVDLLFTAPDVTRIPRIAFERTGAHRPAGDAAAGHRGTARRARPRRPDHAPVVRLLDPRTVCFKLPAAAPEADSSGFWADVVRRRTDQLAGGGLLDGVDAPADGAADRERRGEHLAWHAGRRHHDAGVVLDVARELAVGLQLGERDEDLGLDRDRPLDQLTIKLLGELLGDRPQEHRPRIDAAVHRVAEPHDPAAGGDLGPHPRGGTVRRADRVERVERPTGRAAVQRAGERTERGAHAVGQVGAGRRHDAGGERRRR